MSKSSHKPHQQLSSPDSASAQASPPPCPRDQLFASKICQGDDGFLPVRPSSSQQRRHKLYWILYMSGRLIVENEIQIPHRRGSQPPLPT